MAIARTTDTTIYMLAAPQRQAMESEGTVVAKRKAWGLPLGRLSAGRSCRQAGLVMGASWLSLLSPKLEVRTKGNCLVINQVLAMWGQLLRGHCLTAQIVGREITMNSDKSSLTAGWFVG